MRPPDHGPRRIGPLHRPAEVVVRDPRIFGAGVLASAATAIGISPSQIVSLRLVRDRLSQASTTQITTMSSALSWTRLQGRRRALWPDTIGSMDREWPENGAARKALKKTIQNNELKRIWRRERDCGPTFSGRWPRHNPETMRFSPRAA